MENDFEVMYRISFWDQLFFSVWYLGLLPANKSGGLAGNGILSQIRGNMKLSFVRREFLSFGKMLF